MVFVAVTIVIYTMTDNLKWSSCQIVTFLDVYRKYECLWDVTSPDYLKRDVKREAYTELVNELDLVGLTVTEDCLKKKIKNLRDAYRHELNKVKKNQRKVVLVRTKCINQNWLDIQQQMPFGIVLHLGVS